MCCLRHVSSAATDSAVAATRQMRGVCVAAKCVY